MEKTWCIPENIMVGKDAISMLYLADFGLAMETEEMLLEPRRINSLRGTIKYMSIAAHNGILSFQNDIESLAYMLVELYGQKLPWEPLTADCNQNDALKIYRKVLEAKLAFDVDTTSLPQPLRAFFKASKNLGQLGRPNYDALKSLFM